MDSIKSIILFGILIAFQQNSFSQSLDNFFLKESKTYNNERNLKEFIRNEYNDDNLIVEVYFYNKKMNYSEQYIKNYDSLKKVIFEKSIINGIVTDSTYYFYSDGLLESAIKKIRNNEVAINEYTKYNLKGLVFEKKTTELRYIGSIVVNETAFLEINKYNTNDKIISYSNYILNGKRLKTSALTENKSADSLITNVDYKYNDIGDLISEEFYSYGVIYNKNEYVYDSLSRLILKKSYKTDDSVLLFWELKYSNKFRKKIQREYSFTNDKKIGFVETIYKKDKIIQTSSFDSNSKLISSTVNSYNIKGFIKKKQSYYYDDEPNNKKHLRSITTYFYIKGN